MIHGKMNICQKNPMTFVVAAGLIFLMAEPIWALSKEVNMAKATPAYQAKDYSRLLGTPGLSDALLNNHFKLYQGYVKNTNLLLENTNKFLSEGKDRSPEYAELKRRLGWEFNGMRLHEYYFENLGGKESLDPKSELYQKIVQDFGSLETWRQDFISTGMIRGIGWTVLYLDPQSGRLVNMWINEHDTGHFAGGKPILIMDVFEHAFMLDYQTDRAKYIDVFIAAINWKEAAGRLNP